MAVPFLGLRILRATAGVVGIAAMKASLQPAVEGFSGDPSQLETFGITILVATSAFGFFVLLRQYINRRHADSLGNESLLLPSQISL